MAYQQTRQQHEVIKYIVDEMKRNAESDVVKGLRALNSSDASDNAMAEYSTSDWSILAGAELLSGKSADSTARVTANAIWAWLVFDGGPRSLVNSITPNILRSRIGLLGNLPELGIWDYKPTIRDEKGWGVAQSIDFSLFGKDERVNFFYSIWGNIHYGYVGRAAGFSEDWLIEGANIEHVVSKLSRSPLSDATSFKIGFALYAEGNLSVLSLLRKLYDLRDHLHKYNVNKQGDRTYY